MAAASSADGRCGDETGLGSASVKAVASEHGTATGLAMVVCVFGAAALLGPEAGACCERILISPSSPHFPLI